MRLFFNLFLIVVLLSCSNNNNVRLLNPADELLIGDSNNSILKQVSDSIKNRFDRLSVLDKDACKMKIIRTPKSDSLIMLFDISLELMSNGLNESTNSLLSISYIYRDIFLANMVNSDDLRCVSKMMVFYNYAIDSVLPYKFEWNNLALQRAKQDFP